MIETTEPAEASISARIENLTRQYQQAAQWRQEALKNAQAHGETLLKIQGAIEELQRLQNEIWGNAQGEE